LTDYRINNKKSLNRAQLSITHLAETFGGVRVTNIGTPIIRKYTEKRLEEGAANATVNRELAALKRMLKMGAQCTPPKVNRVPFIPMLKENNTRKGFFELKEFEAVRDHLPDYLKGYVTFAYKEGWRREEISNLKWSDVDQQNWIVRLNPGETKSQEARTVYLDEELKAVFQHQWEARRKAQVLTPYVFPSRDGKGKITDIRKAWKRACEKAGIGKKLFHDFRRTAVRDMIRSGIPEKVAMMISGHKTRSVFDRYNIVSDSDLKHAAAKREAYQREQMGTVTGTITKLNKKKDAKEDA
jgi:integrase